MKKNFLFAALTVLLAGFWFGGASLADCTATEQGDNEAMLSGQSINYCSLSDAIAAANSGDTVTLLDDITLTNNVIIDKSITLNLSGKTITGDTNAPTVIFSGEINAIINGSGKIININSNKWNAIKIGSNTDNKPNVTIVDGTYISLGWHGIEDYGKLTIKNATINANLNSILFRLGASGTIENGTYHSITRPAIQIENSTLTIKDGIFESESSSTLSTITVFNGSELTIIDGKFISHSSSDTIYTLAIHENCTGNINGGIFESENSSTIYIIGASLTINGGTFNAKNQGLTIGANSKLTINGGDFKSSDQGVIYIKANDQSNDVTINGGTFTGSTSTDGLIAYGLAASNAGTVTINGGTFDITNGAGIVARGGNVTLSGAEFNFHNSDSSLSGKLATTMYGVEVPVGYELVMDLAFNLNNPDPVINGVPLTTTNNKTGTLLIVGDEATQKNYVVSISGDAKPLTLTKATNDVSISTLTAEEGYQWYNVADENNKYVYNFAQAVTGNVTLESIINKYKVTFDANTGATTPYEEQEIAHGEKATEPTAPTSGDYAFSGWYLDDELFSFDTAITGDVTLTGKWGFAVTFDGADVAKQIVASGDKATKPSNPSKDCNSFDGWFVDSAFSTGFDFDAEITGNTVIYAKWTYTCSRSSGGGGGSSRTTTTSKDDAKANTGDTAKTDEQKVDENKTEEETVNEENKVEEKAPMTDDEAVAKFGQEQIDAYKWALENGITTMNNVEDARLDAPLTRAELAKMMVVYIAKVLGKQPVLTGNVGYQDVDANKLGDLAGYIQLAYQYQIMGIDANGDPIEYFNPNGLVTRGEYATVFSRVLFGALFNKEGEDFYTDHIEALNKAGILSDTNPTQREMRGWVMLMMYRSTQNADKIAEVISTLGASEEEVADAQSKAEEEKVVEAPEAETTTGDVAEAPEAEASTGAVAE